MTYQEKLKDARWLRKRQEIVERDGGRCRHCASQLDLEVHHRFYLASREPWEYENDALITLCEYCHGTHHIDPERAIDSPVRRPPSEPTHIGEILRGMFA